MSLIFLFDLVENSFENVQTSFFASLVSGQAANHRPFQNVTHSRNTRTVFAAAAQRSGQYVTSKNN